MQPSPPNVPQERPAVDQRLVAPEQRYEAHDGRLIYVSPADEPHGTRHSELQALLEVHVGEDYDVACDMLTRTSELNDVAPDASVFPAARDPKTGGRQLEELAFEVVSTSGLADAGVKAQRLIDRGVRRVFAIDVKRRRLLEWTAEAGIWQILKEQSVLEDAALAVPLPVAALVGAARTDDAIAHALLKRNHPVVRAAIRDGEAKGEARGEARGEAKGCANTLLRILVARGLAPSPEEKDRLLAERDPERLTRWVSRALTVGSVEELLRD